MKAIIHSLIDTDAYKLYMQQAVFELYPTCEITAEFRCRNSENLGDYVQSIKQQIDGMSCIQLTDDEYLFLKSLNLFSDRYLNWLKDYRFNPDQVIVSNHSGKLNIQIKGLWQETILWEVPLLAIISEVAHKAKQIKTNEEMVDAAVIQLKNNLELFKEKATQLKIDLTQYRLIEFGTRRRYSYAVQSEIIKTLKQHSLNVAEHFFSGTSNLHFAHLYQLKPIGTQAHEWFQAHQQLAPNLQVSQRFALSQWLTVYPTQLPIALTDCINMDAFLRDFTLEFASKFKGLRHDSGDPIIWGEKALAHYRKLGLTTHDKSLVFSDNLDLLKSLTIYEHFQGQIQTSFGIGTRLTCDIPGIKPHNIVIKLTSCNGKPVAKISDEPGKIICTDKKFISELANAFNIQV
ncbi:nicotinate phosphoribosyltransferase [Thorsellia anophelis]|uniref:Nicotinate phosphoribosyltransferase n=1 Tax=Thorsellia anophelis DSM 18579 TaxID=1123402 RepID=A0A1I0EHP9_9GAMM|nr:nicotinate phosphoribosyltransferase [Thorsellia anophelis]SET44869.1 nicotinate phosphoribosyltransferase [Thorsellia anophelis DSM 18579]